MSMLFRQDERPGRYASVALERAIDIRQGLTYAVPSELEPLQVGERVIVPLGRNNRPAAGYVVELREEPRPGERDLELKYILERAGRRDAAPAPPLSPALVELGQWIAQYYCCPLGMVMQSMLPAAVKRETGTKKERLLDLAPGKTEAELRRALDDLPPGQRAVLVALLRCETRPVLALALLAQAGVRTMGPARRLLERGLLVEEFQPVVQARWQRRGPRAADRTVQLTAEQQRAFDGVAGDLGRFAVHLIHGVTGSGKTEVYMRLAQRAIAAGKAALILVPEISLTPQTAGRFLARFDPHESGQSPVAILHSGLTAAQRHQQWRRVALGEIGVVVGARSAVFAPFPEERLGLIVVDEEHDGSYKQDQAPRYHARDVAIRRGQLEAVTVVLGSATPSLESYHNALQRRFALHELRQRPSGAQMPSVEVVDFQKANRDRPRDSRVHLLTPRLERALVSTLEAGGQAMLLLNRRGFASYICCPDQRCGWILTCGHCDTTMVYHLHRKRTGGEQAQRDVLSGNARPGVEDRGSVRCHHCLAQQRLPRDCPSCGKRVTAFGFGTQRVEEEIGRLLPDLEREGAIARLDSDTMRRADQYHETLDRFADGGIRVLVGTQMIAKGLDFPNVRLVGVINADTALNLPDFRAAERTFQLVSQVAGRSGRAAHAGLVIVQTMQPEAAPIRFAAGHDYRGFAAAELEARRAVNLPPLTRLARVVVRQRDYARAQELAIALVAGLRRLGPEHEGVRLHGPMPCPISRIADMHRQAVEIFAPSATALQRFITAARNARLLHSDASMAVDVDPVALL